MHAIVLLDGVQLTTAEIVLQYGGERNINPRPSYIRAHRLSSMSVRVMSDVKQTNETRAMSFGRERMLEREVGSGYLAEGIVGMEMSGW